MGRHSWGCPISPQRDLKVGEERLCRQQAAPTPNPHMARSPGSWRRPGDPARGAQPREGEAPQPGPGPLSGRWSVAKLVCRQPPLLLLASSQLGRIPESHCFPGSLSATCAIGTTVLTRDPHDYSARVAALGTAAPTFDRDLLDLPGLLIDPLFPADFFRGAHEFFEFLNLLPARKQESTEQLCEAGRCK